MRNVNEIPEPTLLTKVLTALLCLPFALDSWLNERKNRG